MNIVSFSYSPTGPARRSELYSELGGAYEGNPWLKPRPTRYVGTIEVEWDSDMPQELIDLLERAGLTQPSHRVTPPNHER